MVWEIISNGHSNIPYQRFILFLTRNTKLSNKTKQNVHHINYFFFIFTYTKKQHYLCIQFRNDDDEMLNDMTGHPSNGNPNSTKR